MNGMADQIVITEKTSQAKDIRDAVGHRYGTILPAEGHLFDLVEPEDVDAGWKRWSAILLRPDGLYPTKPASGGNKALKLQAICEALRTAKRVWLATDCDREGQLIGQEILEHYGYRGEVRRVMFTAQDPQTIRDAFAHARPNGDHLALYQAAVARRQADQIYNLSLTRTATVTLAQGYRAVIGVGRVKTPTMAIVCRRELEIRDFVVEPYFEVVATATVADGPFRMRHAPKDRLADRAAAEALAALADGATGPLAVKVEEKRQAPPRLHDLPSLQKLCASRFGWSAAHTLAVAQELYDGAGKKIITYPRAETRYLPENLISQMPQIVAGLQVGQSFASIPVPDPPLIRRGMSGTFSDKGLAGASHHAVIPNANTVDTLKQVWPRLSADERRLFDVIARATLAALMPDFRYRQTTALLDVQGHAFRAVGRQPLELGWRAAFPEWTPAEEKGDEGQLLPVLRNGEGTVLSDPAVEAKETRPPPRYNEGTLIDAMQNAWRFVEDEALRDRLKEAKGIGTPATRAEIIRGLKAQEFLVAQGKNIVPTERGLILFDVLQKADPALVDPGVTAQLERLLDEVLTGTTEMMGAIDAVCAQASRIIGRLTEHAASGATSLVAAGHSTQAASGPDRPPTPAMKAYVISLAKQRSCKPPRGYAGSASICRAFLDKHAGRTGSTISEPQAGVQQASRAKRRPVSEMADPVVPGAKRPGKRKARTPADTQTMSDPPVSPTAGAAADVRLKIPYGNKETAQRLGARYRDGAWYGPAGIDLSQFRDRGWI